MKPSKKREVLPFTKFFPNDWLSDQGLRMCGLAARGLWIELLCLMWKSPRRGYLESSEGVALSEAQLCRVIGEPAERITALLTELDQAGVFSREATSGIIFSRRIVKDVAAFREFSAWGQKGGNPALKASFKGRLNGTLKPQKSEFRSQSSEVRKKEDEPATAEGSPSTPADEIVLTFPCNGPVKEWGLSASTLAEMVKSYPEFDVRKDIELALSKIKTGAVPRKTANGMPKFLWSWLGRTNDSPRNSPAANPQKQPVRINK